MNHTYHIRGAKPIIFCTSLAALLAGAALTGCRDPRRAAGLATFPAVEATIDTNNPTAVARAFLEACAEMNRLGLAGMKTRDNQDAFNHAEGTLKGLADSEGIVATWGDKWGRSAASARAGRIDSIIKNWPSMIAYYADGIDYGTLRVQPRSATATASAAFIAPTANQTVVAYARNPKAQRAIDALRSAAPSPSTSAAFTIDDPRIRREATQAGYPPRPECEIVLGLRLTSSGYRVISVGLANPSTRLAATPQQ